MVRLCSCRGQTPTARQDPFLPTRPAGPGLWDYSRVNSVLSRPQFTVLLSRTEASLTPTLNPNHPRRCYKHPTPTTAGLPISYRPLTYAQVERPLPPTSQVPRPHWLGSVSSTHTHSGRRKLTLMVVCSEEPAASESGAHVTWNSLWKRTECV